MIFLKFFSTEIIIPPVYEVYRGYIVFVFSVTMCVCVCVCVCKLFIPPVYEVYRGYTVFVFSVTMFVGVCVCGCKLFVFVKDFSGTTEPRILKFGTNVGNNLLYCVSKNQPPPAYHSLNLSTFLSLQ